MEVRVCAVIPVLNEEKYISKCVESLLSQTIDIDILVLDGGSTDNSVDIIKSFGQDIYFWKSEKDKGIYDAWNKGLKAAKGDIFAVLSSDDYYYKNTFNIVNKYFNIYYKSRIRINFFYYILVSILKDI